VVAKAPAEVREFVVVEPETNEVVNRPRGTSGEKDRPADPTVAKKITEKRTQAGAGGAEGGLVKQPKKEDGTQDADGLKEQQYKAGDPVPGEQDAVEKDTGEDAVVKEGEVEKGTGDEGPIEEGTVKGSTVKEDLDKTGNKTEDKTEDKTGVTKKTDGKTGVTSGTEQGDDPVIKRGTGSDPRTGPEPQDDSKAKVRTEPGAGSAPAGAAQPTGGE
jgi:hypothetical protein